MIPLIFEKSIKNRKITSLVPTVKKHKVKIADKYLRKTQLLLPEVSELEVIRSYTKRSQQNYSVDTNFYPLGSCTMKYNPRILHTCASIPGFIKRHPYALPKFSQGVYECLYELQDMLKAVTGMPGVSLAPMAGANGEFAGVAMIRNYHLARGDHGRTEIIVPDAAHGTNPASAAMCGYKVVEIPTDSEGDVDLEALKKAVGSQTAGIMLTNPSTLGVFERNIEQISKIMHEAGGLLYYDGANLNAILGKVRPGDMGFDVVHLNLHKTFGTPHGGGGPGCGPVACSERLVPFLPVPMIVKNGDMYQELTENDKKQSIGRLSAFLGNVGIMLRAYVYIRLLGASGLERVSEYATLNSNYLMKCLEKAGYEIPFGKRRASHEFIASLRNEAKDLHITAMDVAKRLLDYGFHAPTTYFPLLIAECLLIEPTETESKQEIDKFVEVMAKILQEAKTAPEKLRAAPSARPLKRLDNVKAVKELNIKWSA
jgi:glycine dehydrogenase subunit 2